MAVVRSTHASLVIGCAVLALAGCSSSKKSADTVTPAGTTSAASTGLPGGSGEDAGGTVERLFAADADLCKLIDVGELNMASGFIFAPGVAQGKACTYATADGKSGLIVTVEKDLPDLVLDSKLKLNGVGNVTVKEVTVKDAKRAVLQTQPLPGQVNQTLIVKYPNGGGIQVLLHAPTLTDQQAISSAESIAKE